MWSIRLTCLVLGLFRCTVAGYDEQFVLSSAGDETRRPVNVAIIGAGPAGASSAYHLAKYAAGSGIPINITVFERNSYIGGRSTTVNVYDDPSIPVELGASIFVKVNKILVDAAQDFNLSSFGFQTEKATVPGAALAVWDGNQFVFVQEGARSYWDIAKMLWKYGLAPIKTLNLMKATVGKFLKMYDEPIFPFESLSQAAEDVGLLAATAATGEQYMSENGITGKFAHDIVQASTRVNYAQNMKHIHGLEAMVCMATEGAMSIDGGNWQIFDNMITASRASRLLGTQVTNVEKQKNGSYALTFKTAKGASAGAHTSQLFDSVILAAPHQFANIDLGLVDKRLPDEIPYVELHVTLFASPHLLSPAFFNLSPEKPTPKVILTTLPPDEEPRDGKKSCGSPGFFSISLLDPVINPKNGRQEYLYKIFSPTSVNSTFLGNILGVPSLVDSDDKTTNKDLSWIYRKIWNSYPYEYPRVTFEDIKLDDDLWYTSGIESFISTMETSALMGMNVAKLVHDRAISK